MRLTKRIGEKVYYTLGKYPETLPIECETPDVRTILKALAAYEDKGEPDELVKPVRCMECIHGKPHRKVGNGITEPPYITGIVCKQFDLFPMRDYDYCSYGERDNPELTKGSKMKHITIFDKPYSPEKIKEAMGIQQAILSGACDKCPYLPQCETEEAFAFPKDAACKMAKGD